MEFDEAIELYKKCRASNYAGNCEKCPLDRTFFEDEFKWSFCEVLERVQDDLKGGA